MKKRTIATVTKNGSVVWHYSWQEIDIETMVRVQMLAEDIAHTLAMKFEETLTERSNIQ